MREPFTVPIRTRGYECDTTRTVPAAVLLSYLEHLRWECMRDPRLGVLDEVHAGYFFVVLEQRLEVLRRVGMGVDLVAHAVLEGVGRSTGWVRHVVTRDDGAVVAHARVRGAWIGPNRQLARIPDRMRQVAREQATIALPVSGDAAPVALPADDRSWFTPPERAYAPLGLELEAPEGGPGEVLHALTVQRSDLDIFDHVNASRYLGFLDDARARSGLDGPLGGPIRRLAIRHPKEAREGDRLTVRLLGTEPLQLGVFRDDELLCGATLELG